MRRNARIDSNQPAIVAALRDAGASVQPLHFVGGGCPDLLVCYRGVLALLELKDGAKPPSARKLTPLEATWIQKWRGPVAIATSIDVALAAIGAGGLDCAENSAGNNAAHRSEQW